MRRQDRRGDGGNDSLCRGRAHHLRHVQERGEGNLHRFVTTGAQVGRQERSLGALECATGSQPVMRRLACIVFLLVLAAAAVAQVRESVTVEVVEVPVYITTADGKPIRGLTKDAFELSIDGKRTPIDYFDEVDFTAPAAGAAQTAPAVRPLRERRLYLLLFDLSFA